MRVLVCGDRFWKDYDKLKKVLDIMHSMKPIICVIEGECKGADLLARKWAEENNIHVQPFPADWRRLGKAAGPIRNKQMLDEGKPDLVVAFHSNINESRGTVNMLTQAAKAGIKRVLFS